ncbi:hypothetical protein [Pseudomonas aeruginosa]|uniref:hypothetical protein n=2 Tax=Pseudomonas TaxID=286 RepID=UPI0004F27882|nr:hypothetical protein [Pseudomonas aeruginosa]EKU1957651.1 hypothetical protein [Pseudomonas aeruginosa]EKW6792516.1 hypothetical protein [Pseudomonas aeruginosa]ELK4917499.1 hypothetical protein [Pseudomonas aeruginosa]EMB2851992.1 hypothetical protein [Pseudomonas aeruginosa]KSC08303.1 hypothetical protein AO880_00775 [Pseudomonas aeruginosa]
MIAEVGTSESLSQVLHGMWLMPSPGSVSEILTTKRVELRLLANDSMRRKGMGAIDLQEASEMLAELERMHSEIEFLMSAGENVKYASPSDVAALQERLKAIKADIQSAAKYETLARRKQTKTELEQAFFGPAVRSASANFRLPSNSNPRSPNWISGLYEVSVDLSYYAHGLRAHIDDAA